MPERDGAPRGGSPAGPAPGEPGPTAAGVPMDSDCPTVGDVSARGRNVSRGWPPGLGSACRAEGRWCINRAEIEQFQELSRNARFENVQVFQWLSLFMRQRQGERHRDADGRGP